MSRLPKGSAAPARRRRTAEEARSAILDAAERRLVASGPGGIRLQEVAAEVGVSHPTVLHHFGSREALVEAVVTRALDSIQTDVLHALQAAPAGEGQVASMFDGVFEALRSRGQGRALLWLALAGQGPKHDDLRLREFAETIHALRGARFGDRAAASFEDSQFTVVLVASALLASSVIGDTMLHDAGVDDAKGPARFRAWLARLLIEHFERG